MQSAGELSSSRRHTIAWPIGLGLLVLVLLSAGQFLGCGSGGGSSNGGLCDQCGDDPDGPCLGEAGRPPLHIEAGAPEASLCPNQQGPCDIVLSCLRKLGSAQRRCFPFASDRLFECDGARANPNTPTQTPTPIPTGTATPTATGPTATAATPTSTAPTPTGPTATPTGATPAATPTAGTVTVMFEVDSDDIDVEQVGPFELTASYPAAKGSFRVNGAVPQCTAEDGDGDELAFTPSDTGAGTLTVSVSSSANVLPVDISCEFQEQSGAVLDESDIQASANITEPSVSVTVDR